MKDLAKWDGPEISSNKPQLVWVSPFKAILSAEAAIAATAQERAGTDKVWGRSPKSQRAPGLSAKAERSRMI